MRYWTKKCENYFANFLGEEKLTEPGGTQLEKTIEKNSFNEFWFSIARVKIFCENNWKKTKAFAPQKLPTERVEGALHLPCRISTHKKRSNASALQSYNFRIKVGYFAIKVTIHIPPPVKNFRKGLVESALVGPKMTISQKEKHKHNERN